jgi:GGDEF domain-containing protein
VPLLVRGRAAGAAPALPNALWLAEDTPADRLVARLASAMRLRTLHATVLARARTLEAERGIVAELPEGDPLDDAAVLVIGRGRHHPTLSVAVGERMGVMGALSVEAATDLLNARELDGIVIGDGLAARAVAAFLERLAEDHRFRDLPVAALGAFAGSPGLPNFVHAVEPEALLARAVPLIRMRALETALKRLLNSIEHKGMIDARTGLFNAQAFGAALDLAIGDCAGRGSALSLARFSFEQPIERRVSMDAARLVSRLMRDTDFACRGDDGSILFAFGDTELRDAHVAARRLASVLRHTMLRLDRERQGVIPSVTLATVKPSDSVESLLERVAPNPASPVAAA